MKRKKPTKKEREWMTALKEMSCIACGIDPKEVHGQPVDVHHICDGGRRLGHMFTLPLCANWRNPFTGEIYHGCHEGDICSIGNTKKSFTAKYGTEMELLTKVNELLGANYDN